ncbi:MULTISPECIES: IS1634 family transposase [unclassified Nocardiopsis]|uniref:IS1634 family transposase n=1 Tax=Nocardiopsis TaxID=2013 RepID=UPI00387B47AF
MASFIRKVPTASGAQAVQIIHKHGRQIVDIDHIGSAHNDAELAALMEIAHQRLHPGQLTLDLNVGPTPATEPEPAPRTSTGSGPRVVGTRSELLWNTLADAHTRLGFDAVRDATFTKLVLARIVEPTSKADTLRVLDELGVPAPSLRTVFRCLARCQERDYRRRITDACLAHARSTTGLALLMYDCTTLYFEAEKEDGLRKVGMSKERRVDPQILVGLLVDATGFPLAVHCFEGNKAETRTLLPVVTELIEDLPGAKDVVVVADAGMLSAANLNALEKAGLRFIVGSRITKAPYDLAEHFQARGTYFEDGQILESARVMGTGRNARTRRVVYQYLFERHQRDQRAINAQISRAEKVADGTRPVKKDRFVRLDGTDKGVDWDLVQRARDLAGLKGYVTNIAPEVMGGQAVIDAYHDLYQVERSFRMAKSDLAARPVFHHVRESIEAHLTIVFTALAVSRHLQAAGGVSIRKIVQTLRPLRSAVIEISGHRLTAAPDIPESAREILDRLKGSG